MWLKKINKFDVFIEVHEKNQYDFFFFLNKNSQPVTSLASTTKFLKGWLYETLKAWFQKEMLIQDTYKKAWNH